MSNSTVSISLVGRKTDVVCATPMDLAFIVPTHVKDIDTRGRSQSETLPAIWSDEFFTIYNDIIRFVVDTNVPGGRYHSTHHLIGVAWIAFVLAKSNGGEAWPPLIYAALLHDYNHAGSYDDAFNIGNTIGSINDFKALDLIEPKWHAETLRLIGDTIWPLPEGKEIDLPAGMLRDADQIYATYFLDTELSERLFSELGPRFGVFRYDEWLKRNIQYGVSLRGTFNTDVGEKMFGEALPAAINLQIDEIVRHMRKQNG